MCETSGREARYSLVRKKLDDMGYLEPLFIESVPLIERLVEDLTQARSYCHETKRKAGEATKELKTMQEQYIPLTTVQKEIVRENNELHQRLIRQNEESEKKLLELKQKLSTIKDAYSELEFKYLELTVQQQENLQGSPSNIKRKDPENLNSVNNLISQISSAACGDSVLRDLEETRKEKKKLRKEIDRLKHQIEVRDNEIQRLGRLLERKLPAISTTGIDCQCQCSIETDRERGRKDGVLREKLKEALSALDEAMKRVQSLSTRLDELERKRVTFMPSKSVDDIEDKLFKCRIELKEAQCRNTGLLESLDKLKIDLKEYKSQKNDLQRENERLNERLSRISENGPQPPQSIGDYGQCSDCGCHPPKECSYHNIPQTVTSCKESGKEETKGLTKEISALRNELSRLGQDKRDEICRLKSIIMNLEDNLLSKTHEFEIAIKKNSSLSSTIRKYEEEVRSLEKRMEDANIDSMSWKSKYNQIQVVNKHIDVNMKNTEDKMKRVHDEINSCYEKIKSLEVEKQEADAQITSLRREKIGLKESLARLDREKDGIILKLDEKAVDSSKLENELKRKITALKKLEQERTNFENQIHTMELVLKNSEEKIRKANFEVRRQDKEIQSLKDSREAMLLENRRLQSDLAAVTKEFQTTKRELEAARQECQDLKCQLQNYVEEVRNIEELLREKEYERDQLLEQFKVLSVEASNLETNNVTLETETVNTQRHLQLAQDKVNSLESVLHDKDSLVESLQKQVQELSAQVGELLSKASQIDSSNSALFSDLEAARKLCSFLEKQKSNSSSQLKTCEATEMTLKQQIDYLQQVREQLEFELKCQKNNASALQEALTLNRQQVMEKDMHSETLKDEVRVLKLTVQQLEDKLKYLSKTFTECRQACTEYHTELVQIKRELTNEKYEKARTDDSRSFSASL